MLFIEALETAQCFEEGVITSAAAANIGSIMGIGFPALTGGAAQFMTGWQALDDRTGGSGLAAFVARADELAEAYGDRFRPTDRLRRDGGAAGESLPRLMLPQARTRAAGRAARQRAPASRRFPCSRDALGETEARVIAPETSPPSSSAASTCASATSRP